MAYISGASIWIRSVCCIYISDTLYMLLDDSYFIALLHIRLYTTQLLFVTFLVFSGYWAFPIGKHNTIYVHRVVEVRDDRYAS